MRSPLFINIKGKLQDREEFDIDQWVEVLKHLADDPSLDDDIIEISIAYHILV
jgi:hypothetical protein